MGCTEQNVVSEGFIERFERRYPTRILETLLCDRTTGRNIIWADNEYEALGEGYLGDDEICVEKITGLNSGVIKPRIAKEQERQSQRTKSRAEVFTPSWLCNQMNNDLDAVWFGRRDVFNVEDGQAWVASTDPACFPKKKGHGWHAYVESRRLEITCGEAPFVCSRYDTVTGDFLPVSQRVGFLDRKLRIVNEKTKTRKTWVKHALVALGASYGFEYQGDNLLLARINVFETFCEHFRDRWGVDPSDEEIDRVAEIVSWNFWQMNGFTDAVPTNKMGAVAQSTIEPKPMVVQDSLFDLFGDEPRSEALEGQNGMGFKGTVPLCVIFDWNRDEPFEFAALKGDAVLMGKKFYAVIGNPPYQEQVSNGNKTYAPPIYHEFMESAFSVSEKVELVTPARFLFDAGSTPKAWNRKMLKDPHFKVQHYEADCSVLFPGTSIKGGVAITYRDSAKDFGPIGHFVVHDDLRSILGKVWSDADAKSLSAIIFASESYKFTETMHEDNPKVGSVLSKGHRYDLKTSVLGNLDGVIFFDAKPSDDGYVKVLGLVSSLRKEKWVKKEYITGPENFDKYKVFVPAANGSGALGEVLSSPLVAPPMLGHTQTFLSIGCFESETEAEALLKYIKSKFCRVMLGILKITQHNPAPKWKFVPLQDFTSDSDIDWSQSISDIDKQLYAKYGLDESEIEFIETHVKEMS